jgi:hypothetical protein
MKWVLLGIVVLLLLPFYSYIMSKAIVLGKLQVIQKLSKGFKDGKDQEEE